MINCYGKIYLLNEALCEQALLILQGVGIGQLLLDVGALEHVSKEQVFEDKDQYYRFNTEVSYFNL